MGEHRGKNRQLASVALEAFSLSQLCFHWPPTSSSRRSLRFTARKRPPETPASPTQANAYSVGLSGGCGEWLAVSILASNRYVRWVKPIGALQKRDGPLAHRGVLK